VIQANSSTIAKERKAYFPCSPRTILADSAPIDHLIERAKQNRNALHGTNVFFLKPLSHRMDEIAIQIGPPKPLKRLT
jgi:hypothetical protein